MANENKIIWVGDSQTALNTSMISSLGSKLNKKINYYAKTGADCFTYTKYNSGFKPKFGAKVDTPTNNMTNVKALQGKKPSDAWKYIKSNFDIAFIALGHNCVVDGKFDVSGLSNMVQELLNANFKWVFIVRMFYIIGDKIGNTWQFQDGGNAVMSKGYDAVISKFSKTGKVNHFVLDNYRETKDSPIKFLQKSDYNMGKNNDANKSIVHPKSNLVQELVTKLIPAQVQKWYPGFAKVSSKFDDGSGGNEIGDVGSATWKGGRPMGCSEKQLQDAIWVVKALVKEGGCTLAGACGVVGNAYGECGWRDGLSNQWGYGGWWGFGSHHIQAMKSMNLDYLTKEGGTAYLIKYNKGTYLASVKNASDPREASMIFANKFEIFCSNKSMYDCTCKGDVMKIGAAKTQEAHKGSKKKRIDAAVALYQGLGGSSFSGSFEFNFNGDGSGGEGGNFASSGPVEVPDDDTSPLTDVVNVDIVSDPSFDPFEDTREEFAKYSDFENADFEDMYKVEVDATTNTVAAESEVKPLSDATKEVAQKTEGNEEVKAPSLAQESESTIEVGAKMAEAVPNFDDSQLFDPLAKDDYAAATDANTTIKNALKEKDESFTV